MATPLTRLLYEANKGCCMELLKSKEFNKKESLQKYEKQISKCLGGASNSQWDIAITIAKFVRSGAWAAFYDETSALYDKWNKDNLGASCSDNPYYPTGGVWWSDNSIYLLTFLKEKFGICRTTLYNYLEVVDEFCTYVTDSGKEPEYQIGAEAKFFQFWQLVEMVSLTYNERKNIQPNWTRAEIRAYKKSLKDKDKKQIQPAELNEVEAEEKPLSEAEQRFAKYSKGDLINHVLELENKVKELSDKLEAYLPGSSNPAASGLEAKHAIQSRVEKLLNSYQYEIKLNGRKQGFKPFAGVIAKHVLEDLSNVVVNISEPIQQEISV